MRAAMRDPRSVPLYFDIKSRQPRIAEATVEDGADGAKNLVLRLTHAIAVRTPTPVLFKAGDDGALLTAVEDDGTRLVFDGVPRYRVKPGESLCIREPDLRILDDVITDVEAAKIAKVKEAGVTRWFLSYVEQQYDVDRFLELVGRDAEVFLKIESPRGLEYVAREFRKRDNLRLVAACGDLFVEIDRPHRMPEALRLIIGKDPEACAASRMMLSLMRDPIPDLADFLQVGWLLDAGYRSLMLCDGLCLEERKLATAISAIDAFRKDYVAR
jgi:hypothetical protein